MWVFHILSQKLLFKVIFILSNWNWTFKSKWYLEVYDYLSELSMTFITWRGWLELGHSVVRMWLKMFAQVKSIRCEKVLIPHWRINCQNCSKLPEKSRFGTVPSVFFIWFFHHRVYRVSLPLKSQKKLLSLFKFAFKSTKNQFLSDKNLKFMNFPSCYVHETWIFRIGRPFYI